MSRQAGGAQGPNGTTASPRRRRTPKWLAMATLTALLISACQVDGTAQPDAAAVAALSSAAALSSSQTAASSSPGSSTSARATTPRLSAATSPGTIEDRSTGLSPTSSGSTGSDPTNSGPTTDAADPNEPTVLMADDGFAVSVIVTTLWSRALVARGVKVGIRTIGETAQQVTALKSGQVDLVQQYNSGLLDYLDPDSEAIGQPAVDAAIAGSLPAGLSVLRSTPAKDDVQLAVSTATATRYSLHSITDLGAHLADLTLLLPEDSSASSFTNGLSNYYGLTFANVKTTDFGGSRTIAAIKSTPSVGLMDASQYQIDDNKFVVLTDPKHLFLTENFIPLVGGKKLTAAMKATVNAVSAKLTVAALRGLRKEVATGQGSVAQVADQWLASVGLR